MDSLGKLLSTTSRENKICYVMGDFNLDLLRHDQHAITGEFFELMFSHLLYPMITKPTRIKSNTTSLIDDIFANNVTCLSVNGLIVNDLSDRLLIFQLAGQTLITTLVLKEKASTIPQKNNYQECDLRSHFINFLDNTLDKDPNTVFVCGGDLNHLDLNRLQSMPRPGVTRV